MKSFLLALRFAVSQGGIAARALTLMQGSEGKEKTEHTVNQSTRETHHHFQS